MYIVYISATLRYTYKQTLAVTYEAHVIRQDTLQDFQTLIQVLWRTSFLFNDTPYLEKLI